MRGARPDTRGARGTGVARRGACAEVGVGRGTGVTHRRARVEVGVRPRADGVAAQLATVLDLALRGGVAALAHVLRGDGVAAHLAAVRSPGLAEVLVLRDRLALRRGLLRAGVACPGGRRTTPSSKRMFSRAAASSASGSPWRAVAVSSTCGSPLRRRSGRPASSARPGRRRGASARLRDRGLVAVRVLGPPAGSAVAVAARLVAVERVELAGVARVVFVPSEELVDGLAEAAAAALVVLVLGGHRVRSSVVVAVVFLWDSPCSRASISAR